MNKSILIALLGLLLGCTTADTKKELDNVFYCFNNGIRMLPNAPEDFHEQAALIKKIGFNGLSGHVGEDYFTRRKSLDKAGVEMPEIYWGMTVIEDSKDRNLLVAIFLNAKQYAANRSEGDKLFVKGFQELADFAAPFNVKLAIYPHANNYCETTANSVKLVTLIDRKNVGVIFNTCHLLKVEGEDKWEQKVITALPYLFMVSINGADSGNTKEMGWDRLIQPLGEGSFDTYKLVKLLKDNDYTGMFGLQCYNIKQDCEVALTKSMNTWKSYQVRYQKEND
jgi:sugar phosphate isomerase/epimerase